MNNQKVTTEERQQLHAILDLLIDISNQDIARPMFDWHSTGAHLLLSSDTETLCNLVSLTNYGEMVEWLNKVSIGDLDAIPGYAKDRELKKAIRLAEFEKLRAEFEPVKNESNV